MTKVPDVVCGFDIGSTFTKTCVLTDDKKIIMLDSFPSPVAGNYFFANYFANLRRQYNIKALGCCGWGRESAACIAQSAIPVVKVSELSALAEGLAVVAPELRCAIDIGGQDSKAILTENGKVKRFAINDQCAAGSGIFLQNVLRMLHIDFADLRVNPSIKHVDAEPLTTVCAVFAQTEIVRRLSAGENADDLARSALISILRKAAALISQLRPDTSDSLAFTGGFALIPRIAPCFERLAGYGTTIPPYPSSLAAIGCCKRASRCRECE